MGEDRHRFEIISTVKSDFDRHLILATGIMAKMVVTENEGENTQ